MKIITTVGLETEAHHLMGVKHDPDVVTAYECQIEKEKVWKIY